VTRKEPDRGERRGAGPIGTALNRRLHLGIGAADPVYKPGRIAIHIARRARAMRK
jgi:hypothetical protein